MRILLIEDNETIGGAVRDHAAADGHAVDWARSLQEGRELLDVMSYGLVLLDLSLPDGDGVDLLRSLRARSVAVPVMIITARDQIGQRIDGLNAGADDYLVKPFDLDEMSARIHAVSRRSGGRSGPVFEREGLRIAPAERAILRDGVPVDLTAREWAVLDALLARPGAILTKPQLEDALYAFGAEIESNAVEVYVSRIRKKLGADRIATVRGIGYRLTG
ncbi:MAG: response regulator transcription factor [Rhizobiaceae bacterium]|nr:response regulator transcription factor [Rhizobiaceae bacterium]